MERSYNITGFADFSNVIFKGWNNVSIRNLESLILALTSDTRTQQLYNFSTKIRSHLVEHKAHDFSIEKYANTLIDDLYDYYRESGFKGDRNTMLLDLYVDIDIATSLDVDTGLSKTKVITTQDWLRIFNLHENNKLAHSMLFKLFRPEACVESTVDLVLNNGLRDVTDNRLSVKNWNGKVGTFALEFNYDKTNRVILEFKGNKTTQLRTVVTDDALTLYLNDTELLTLPENIGYCKLLMVSNGNNLIVRTALQTAEVYNQLIDTSMSDIVGSDDLFSLTHYINTVDQSEQTFLLN